jgi:hypothetical protein
MLVGMLPTWSMMDGVILSWSMMDGAIDCDDKSHRMSDERTKTDQRDEVDTLQAVCDTTRLLT